MHTKWGNWTGHKEASLPILKDVSSHIQLSIVFKYALNTKRMEHKSVMQQSKTAWNLMLKRDKKLIRFTA